GERAGALRAVETRELGRAAVPGVLDVLDLDLVAHGHSFISRLEEVHDSPIDVGGPFDVDEVTGAGEDDLLEALQEQVVHALERLEPSGSVPGAVQRERGDGRRRR